MAAMVTINCEQCGKAKSVRVADRKRGWGRFCSKRCKTVNQDKKRMFEVDDETLHLEAMEGAEGYEWDAHKFWRIDN